MLWESTREPNQEPEKSNSYKGVHVDGNSIATEAKLATLTRRLEALETKNLSFNCLSMQTVILLIM